MVEWEEWVEETMENSEICKWRDRNRSEGIHHVERIVVSSTRSPWEGPLSGELCVTNSRREGNRSVEQLKGDQ